jgi:hypothetical protein
VLALADNDVWVAGPLGQVRHFNGQHWMDSASRVTTDSIVSFSVMQQIDDVVYGAAFNGFIHRYRGQLFGRMFTASATPVNSIWSAHPNATFVGDLRGGVLRYNGQSWTRDVVDTMQQNFQALWGSSDSDVWGSGAGGRVYHYNGSSWTFPTTASGSVNTIWGTGPNDVWFFGSGALHYNGSMFVPVTTGATYVAAASGSGPNDIWLLDPITAISTRVVRWNGTMWSSTMMPHDMTAIVVLGSDNVFITADNNHVLHYNGTAWTDTTVPASTRLTLIDASAPDDVVAASTTEAVHFDGKSWAPIRVPVETGTIRGITVAPAHIDFLLSTQTVRRLARTRFWSCRASETGCNDGVDDDCDGAVDLRDSDC